MFIFCHIREKSIKCLQKILDEIVQKSIASKFVYHISMWINRGNSRGRTKDGVRNKKSAKTSEGCTIVEKFMMCYFLLRILLFCQDPTLLPIPVLHARASDEYLNGLKAVG
jgi:hypothetical protein